MQFHFIYKQYVIVSMKKVLINIKHVNMHLSIVQLIFNKERLIQVLRRKEGREKEGVSKFTKQFH